MEYRRFAPGESHVSTFEFHEHRERAPHLEQGVHRPRLMRAAEYVISAAQTMRAPVTVCDLGCGDGGLISVLKPARELLVFGYDFQPSNVKGWNERGVLLNCKLQDFVHDFKNVRDADVYVMTEVLEHLDDPHGMLRQVRERSAHLVCSSPWMEHEGNIDACHAWAWDMPGYIEMIHNAGFEVRRSAREGIFQVHWAVPR